MLRLRVSCLLIVVGLLAIVPVTHTAAAAPPAPSGIGVDGNGVGVYPAFDPAVHRYAITSTDATDGVVTVRVQSPDQQLVRVNGRPAPGGSATVAGLVPGEEISVLVGQGAAASAYALVYLPPGFPTLAATISGPVQPGAVLLTMGKWLSPGSFFETAVDRRGVPLHVQETPNSMDLKRLSNGHYSVARGKGDRGADIVELDETFAEVGRYRTVGLTHTDGHDALFMPDGSRYLMAYEPDEETGRTDAVVQHISGSGEVLFEWNSADHVDIPAETVIGDDADYAHINSFEVMDDGDLLMSFRHFSSVFKVARTAHDGFEPGDIVWRLGGRRSDFTFADGTGGPCAQHTAHELGNGDVMVFDNGAWSPNPLCPDPADPAGEPVARTPSRVAVFSLDESSGTATTVRDVRVADRYAIFAGSAQPLRDDHIMIGWASSTQAVASEVDAGGRTVWELTNPDETKQFTYRAHLAEVPDAIEPVADLALGDDSTFEVGEAAVPVATCTDRGGSTLRSCEVTGFDTSTPGQRTATLVAEDGDGNRTVVQQDYSVATQSEPVRQPDVFVKLVGRSGQVGRREFGPPRQQTLGLPVRKGRRATALVTVRNAGETPERFALRSTRWGRAFGIRWSTLPRRTPVLEPGERWRSRVSVRPAGRASRGDITRVRLTARSLRDTRAADAAQVRARVR